MTREWFSGYSNEEAGVNAGNRRRYGLRNMCPYNRSSPKYPGESREPVPTLWMARAAQDGGIRKEEPVRTFTGKCGPELSDLTESITMKPPGTYEEH